MVIHRPDDELGAGPSLVATQQTTLRVPPNFHMARNIGPQHVPSDFGPQHASLDGPYPRRRLTAAQLKAERTQPILARATLKPYIQELDRNVTSRGVPTMRPLAYEFPGDSNCRGINDQ